MTDQNDLLAACESLKHSLANMVNITVSFSWPNDIDKQSFIGDAQAAIQKGAVAIIKAKGADHESR